MSDQKPSLGLKPQTEHHQHHYKVPSKAYMEKQMLHISSKIHSHDLIQADLNHEVLTDSLNKIVQAINQHARMLDGIQHTMSISCTGQDIGEMFNILTHGFPYGEVLEKSGLDPTSSQPRVPFISEQLMKRGISMNSALVDQLKHPVKSAWDGFDRFCKV